MVRSERSSAHLSPCNGGDGMHADLCHGYVGFRPLPGCARRDDSAPGKMVAEPPDRPGDKMMKMTGTTYLLGLGELDDDPEAHAWICVGSRLVLRHRPHTASRTGSSCLQVEVSAPDGRPLGYLPPDDACAVAELLDAGLSAVARVSALVPAFRRQRVQLAIEVGQANGGMSSPNTGRGDMAAPSRPWRRRRAVLGEGLTLAYGAR